MKTLDKLLAQLRPEPVDVAAEISRILLPLRREALLSLPYDERRAVLADPDPEVMTARMNAAFIKHGLGYLTCTHYLTLKLCEAAGLDPGELG